MSIPAASERGVGFGQQRRKGSDKHAAPHSYAYPATPNVELYLVFFGGGDEALQLDLK